MGNNNKNKFNLNEAIDKINIFKRSSDVCLDIQDKAMDIHSKHSKARNMLLDKYSEERNRITEERDKELERLDSIENLDERLNKKEKVRNIYKTELEKIDKNMKELDDSKFEFGDKAIGIGVKVAAILALGAAGVAGANKYIGNEENDGTVEKVLETDEYNFLDEDK